MKPTDYTTGWADGYAKAMENGKRISGVFDKTGKMIHAGDKVKGLFWLGEEITGVCTFREGAYGIRWMRGGAEEFTAFCQCCNVEWEVQE